MNETETETNPKTKIFNHLDIVLALARNKLDNYRTKDNVKQSWSRILIMACRTYGDLLELETLEHLSDRIKIIESKLEVKV